MKTVVDYREEVTERAEHLAKRIRSVDLTTQEGTRVLRRAWVWLCEWRGTRFVAPVIEALASVAFTVDDLRKLAETSGWRGA